MRPVRRGARQSGQATVEFALVLPVVLIALLSVVQVGVVVYAQLDVTHDAREVARRLAVDASLDPGELQVELGHDLEVSMIPPAGAPSDQLIVDVVVSAPVAVVTPLFAPLLDGFRVQARAAMLLE